LIKRSIKQQISGIKFADDQEIIENKQDLLADRGSSSTVSN
jgi:hypothetical protein